MKKLLYILILFAVVSCNKENVEKDNDNPLLFIPRYGFSINDIWNLSDGTDTHYLTIYCSGLYNGAKEDISVQYSIDPSLINNYNNDETQLYSGSVIELPSDCYRIDGTNAVIKKGESEVKIPIVFDVAKIKQSCLNNEAYYTIPIKLNSTSKYLLHNNLNMTEALYGINLKDPVFFFYENRNGLVIKDMKVIYGVDNQSQSYSLTCEGVPEGSYDVDIEYNIDALESEFDNATPLPQNGFEIVNSNIIFNSIYDKPELNIKYLSDILLFRQVYYLPLSIKKTSAYKPDEDRSTLIVKVEMKNEYDKNYNSKLSVHSGTSSRTGSYEVEKSLSSYESNIVEMQIAKNATIAGAGNTGTSSTYNDKYMRIKVIPTDNKEKYNVELILVTDMGKSNNSPNTLELDPEKESYYNWNKEEFVLNYRWKHTDGKYITVTEILSAK